jgi:dTDP-4-dehydrorhamnose reductase
MISYSPKILITGSHGQLGLALHHHYLAQQFDLTFCPQNVLDITNSTSVENTIRKFSPDILINTAAFTAVDKAEEEQEKALQVNAVGAKNLAKCCNNQHIILIHISTDYIFNGKKDSPYVEEDALFPLNFYGQSKSLGEEQVRENCEKHIILRVSALFSEYRTNFVKTILRLAQEKNELNVVADQVTCPTYAGDIASALFSLASLAKNPSQWGTYHYCSSEAVSWHTFASTILKEAERFQSLKTRKINAVSTGQFKTLAIRPSYSVMDCTKIHETFGIMQPVWRKALTNVVAKLLQEKS